MGKRKLRKNNAIDSTKSCKTDIHDIVVGLNTDNDVTERLFNVKTNKSFCVRAYKCLVQRGLLSDRATYVINDLALLN